MTGVVLIGQLATELKLLGFRQVARSRNGSRYFVYPPGSHRLRIANHDLPPLWSIRHQNTVLSYTAQSATKDEVPLVAFDIAIRFIASVAARTGKW